MSNLLDQANAIKAIGANYCVLVFKGQTDTVDYHRFYKRGTWETSRNCLLYYNYERMRWDNSSELSFGNIQRGFKWTKRKYSIIDFDNETRENG